MNSSKTAPEVRANGRPQKDCAKEREEKGHQTGQVKQALH